MVLCMLRITQTKRFEKDFKKTPESTQDKFLDRLKLFIENPVHPILRRHDLHGKYKGCVSINITGDCRAIFEFVSKDQIEFQRIGTHNQLYK